MPAALEDALSSFLRENVEKMFFEDLPFYLVKLVRGHPVETVSEQKYEQQIYNETFVNGAPKVEFVLSKNLNRSTHSEKSPRKTKKIRT